MIYIVPTNTCFWIACPISEIESYEKLYEIKQRDKSKAIAIMVMDFDYFKENTDLNLNQIKFLEDYENPFTILIDRNKIFDTNLLNIINWLSNSEIYKKIAFRVSHTFMHRDLIEKNWLLFLTSANISNNPEIFDTETIKKEFWDIIEEEQIQVFAHWEFKIESKQKHSDIIEFKGESDQITFFRR